MRKLLPGFLLLLSLSFTPASAEALTASAEDAHAAPAGNGGSSVTLASLLEGGEIVVGDKRFDGFTYEFTGDMPSAADVNVVPIDEGGVFGIRFQGAFIDLASTQGGSDALIGYTVSVTNAAFSIVGALMAGNPTLLSEFGSISAVDTFDFDSQLRLRIFDDEESGTQSKDAVTFAPLDSIRVHKDILGIAVGSEGQGTVTLSFVDQTYTQTGGTAPEPSALLLLGGSLLLIVGLRRSRL